MFDIWICQQCGAFHFFHRDFCRFCGLSRYYPWDKSRFPNGDENV